ncbi:MAG: hypothetical protein QM535_03665 [Limnohabitans sp.]|nr:hypothetical protein [Limnohabitans sp.]
MNIDILLYILSSIPLFIVGFQIEKLNAKKVLFIWFLVAIALIIIGYMVEDNSNNEMRSISYFGSQMLFIFLILHTITRTIYFKIFNREPELGKFPKHKIDYIYTFIVIAGTMVLPFLLDAYIFHKF